MRFYKSNSNTIHTKHQCVAIISRVKIGILSSDGTFCDLYMTAWHQLIKEVSQNIISLQGNKTNCTLICY